MSKIIIIQKDNFFLKISPRHLKCNFKSHDENISPNFLKYFIYSLEKFVRELFSQKHVSSKKFSGHLICSLDNTAKHSFIKSAMSFAQFPQKGIEKSYFSKKKSNILENVPWAIGMGFRQHCRKTKYVPRDTKRNWKLNLWKKPFEKNLRKPKMQFCQPARNFLSKMHNVLFEDWKELKTNTAQKCSVGKTSLDTQKEFWQFCQEKFAKFFAQSTENALDNKKNIFSE